MSLPQLESQQKVIGGRVFTVGVLSFAQSRKVFGRIQRILVANDEVIQQTGLGLFLFASMAGALTDDDLNACIETFGEVTSVALDDNRVLKLNIETNRNAAFMGRHEDMYEWLDFAVDVSFKALMAKMKGAPERLAASAKTQS